MTDRERFLQQAKTYLGVNGRYVCLEKLKIGFICDWCAFSVSSIMRDCGFVGKYIKAVEGGAGTIPRYSDGKYGVWFRKGTQTPQSGDLFFLRYADYPSQDKYFCDHVGIVEAVSGNTITTLEGNVDGWGSNWASTSTFKRKVRSLNDNIVYAFYRPNWQGERQTSATSTSAASSTATSGTATPPDVIYQVHTMGGSWLENVKNCEDYAGLENRTVDGLLATVSRGWIRYRVHIVGGTWLPWVTDRSDYAGIIGRPIDAIQMELAGLESYAVEYRVSTTNSAGYLPWVRNWNSINDDGYAGVLGTGIDKLQVRVVEKQPMAR